MIVVSDTTPLRYLTLLGLIDVVPRLFGQVHCPDIVLVECLHESAPMPLRAWAAAPPSWLIVEPVAEFDLDLESLDDGEAAAITLARKLKADALLIDELKARRMAAGFGFIVSGTLNILAQAGVRGWLDYHAVAQQLRASTNFRFTDAVADAVWRGVSKG